MTAPLAIALDPAPDPLALLERVASLRLPAFLDAAAGGELGRWSYLAWDPVHHIEATAEEWPRVRATLRATTAARHPGAGLPPFAGGWIGWLAYELGRAFDRQPMASRDPLAVADVSLALYDLVVAWDHQADRAWLISTGCGADGGIDHRRAADRLAAARAVLAAGVSGSGGGVAAPAPRNRPASASTASFTAAGYLAAVGSVIEHIRAGDIFQANLSQRYHVACAGDRVALYRRLRTAAPGSHAAFLDRGRVAALSVSPERFLRYDSASRAIETRPIKGTRPRHPDPARDREQSRELVESVKDRAENVMIVDLLRNDLARVAEPESVAVTALCRLESYAAVHHLVSVVEGRLASRHDACDLIEATFPAGSITGAPKLRAMEILAALEPERRGIYCGAIGWIGLDGSMDLNVAIRTITLADGTAVVGAGGGVTLLSDPQAEHAEVLDKARALVGALEAST